MNKNELYYFTLLKKKITITFLKNYTASKTIEEWKGDEITAFQEDLFATVKGRVSEKWFYTYFKNTPNKLPRIDMLNLLSKYVGFNDWNAFKTSHKIPIQNVNQKTKYGIVVLVVILILTSLYFSITEYHKFEFCFVDAIKNKAITHTQLDIKVLPKNESPLYFKTDASGCFQFESEDDYIRFVIQSPYHKTDTIYRTLTSKNNTMVKVAADDYALLLEYYANGNVKNRVKHKIQLHKLIADKATIYQLFDDAIGIELYSKEDFIRFTTLPTSTVKRITILEKKMENGKIVTLKFIVK